MQIWPERWVVWAKSVSEVVVKQRAAEEVLVAYVCVLGGGGCVSVEALCSSRRALCFQPV